MGSRADRRWRAVLWLAAGTLTLYFAVRDANGRVTNGALASLDFMVSVDIYLNETTRHANVILPGPSPLEQSHFDIAFPQMSVRNWVRYSHPVFEPPPSTPDEWEILLRLLDEVEHEAGG